MEIKYEEVCRDPMESIRGILQFSEVEWGSRFEAGVKEYRLKSANEKYRIELTSRQQDEMEEVLKPYLEKYGYA